MNKTRQDKIIVFAIIGLVFGITLGALSMPMPKAKAEKILPEPLPLEIIYQGENEVVAEVTLPNNVKCITWLYRKSVGNFQRTLSCDFSTRVVE